MKLYFLLLLKIQPPCSFWGNQIHSRVSLQHSTEMKRKTKISCYSGTTEIKWFFFKAFILHLQKCQIAAKNQALILIINILPSFSGKFYFQKKIELSDAPDNSVTSKHTLVSIFFFFLHLTKMLTTTRSIYLATENVYSSGICSLLRNPIES